MIILNPEHGATISDFQYKGTYYFSAENDETFKPGEMLEFDEVTGRFFLEHYGFLVEMSTEDAKSYKNRKDVELKCDKCEFTSINEVTLTQHKKKHEETASLGLKKVQGKKVVLEDMDMEVSIENEAKAAGLEGEGLVKEKPRKRVVMK